MNDLFRDLTVGEALALNQAYEEKYIKNRGR
jgi:hypothetical protein